MARKLPPEGFEPIKRTSPFRELVGPFYVRHGEDGAADVAFGMVVQEKHGNMRMFVHGGMLATLADTALGYAISSSRTPPLSLVTTSLSIDYVGNAEVGDWIEARVDVQKIGRRVAFASCYIYLGEERIVRASGAFLVLPTSTSSPEGNSAR